MRSRVKNKINRRSILTTAAAASLTVPVRHSLGSEWPSFRGSGGLGVDDSEKLPVEWSVGDGESASEGIKWKVDLPGLAHGSPILVDGHLYLTNAVADSGTAELKVGRSGAPTAADDNGIQRWQIHCLDANMGEETWTKIAKEGPPGATRHVKATHANTTMACSGDHLVAFFGSEGLYNFRRNGELRWKKDLGIVNISKYGIGWGYASSPAIFGDRIVLLCDDPDNPYVVCLSLETGEEIWRKERKGISERSWATPLIAGQEISDAQVVINGWPWIVSYNLKDGTERWKMQGGGDNPVPTPFVAHGYIYVTNAHGGPSPIYAIRPDASGDITPGKDNAKAFAWQTQRGGSYMSTPVVYGEHIYFGNTNGAVRCFNALTGEPVYEKRLDTGAAIYASLVAGDGKIYAASENGITYVIRAGTNYELLAKNPMASPCFASPLIADGTLYFRTTTSLIAVG